ncbi:MAG: asparagine synthase (glutamine-hydrolyzing) [Pseudorhodobacter sp.]|nr:asparagine synthase (glutamine-hydrolyzing) [Pseudorhodobacter sp.]
MCGIAGYLSRRTAATEEIAHRMADRLRHRGPDGEGIWCDRDAGIALAHRRLAIIDLSVAGQQPMVSADGRFVIVFNGEIYNHHALRRELGEGAYPFQGHSDTETMLAAFQLWGLPRTLTRLNGMFAIALWDRLERRLTLIRDRLGEKPLYYGWAGETFLFGSELKALTCHPDWQGEIDRDVLALYTRRNYVPAPHSIYRGIAKLPPGHMVEIALEAGVAAEPVAYWSLDAVAHAGLSQRRTAPPEVLVAELDQRLRLAVKLRMEADVPLGAFLSGGIDSSLIVALMQAQSDHPVQTFTIGFDVPGFNEADQAKAVAAHLGTRHTELYVSPQDALDLVPRLPEIWDEPFADMSQLPTLILSRMTREHVTVALSGDGGDELFAGYNRYAKGYDLHRKLRRLPGSVRRLLSTGINLLPAHAIDRLMQRLPQKLRYPAVGDRLHKLAAVMRLPEGPRYYNALVSQFWDPGSIVTGAVEPETILNRPEAWPEFDDFRETMMYLDTLTYLPDDILTKVDRASMAFGLEARVPYLDHDLVEFAWRLPLDLKLRGGQSKWALRQVLDRYVPRSLSERPKMGFGIPIEHWLTGELRDWAETLLDPRRLAEEGFFDPVAVRALWDAHCTGRRRCHHQLWNLLMFQAWNERRAAAAGGD